MYKYLSLFALIVLCLSLAPQSLSAAQKSNPASAALYYHPNCPHCETVIRYLNQHNQTVRMKNITNPTYSAELKRLGHNGVPVLVVENRSIAGASRIINYLQKHPEAAQNRD